MGVCPRRSDHRRPLNNHTRLYLRKNFGVIARTNIFNQPGTRPKPGTQTGSIFEPIRILEIDIGEPIQEIQPEISLEGNQYKRARHSSTSKESLSPGRYHPGRRGIVGCRVCSQIWVALRDQINFYLRQIGMQKSATWTCRYSGRETSFFPG